MPKKTRKNSKSHEPEGAESGMRGMWTGTISFGLVSVPVSLYPAIRKRPVHLRWLSKDGVPLKRQYVCSQDQQPLQKEDLVRGYEVENGKVVLVKDEELDAIAPDKTRDISLQSFVKLSQIPDFYFDRPYFLAPAGGSAKAYQLLAYVLAERECAGIGSFVMRGKEYLVAIVSAKGMLMAETLRFHTELREPAQIPLPQPEVPSEAGVKQLRSAIRSLRRKTVDEALLADRYALRLQRLISIKSESEKAVVHHEQHEEERTGVVDLVALFQARMQEAERDQEGSPGGYAELTKEELYERAQAANIHGRSKMTKEELIAALSS